MLDESADPAARARLYDTRVKEELTPYYDDMRSQDRMAIRRAAAGLDPDYEPPLQTRVLRAFLNDGARIAVRADIGLLRAAMRDFHMLDRPRQWMRRPANVAKMLGAWARGKERNAALYPPSLGPSRTEMMAVLGLETGGEKMAAE